MFHFIGIYCYMSRIVTKKRKTYTTQYTVIAFVQNSIVYYTILDSEIKGLPMYISLAYVKKGHSFGIRQVNGAL